MRIIGWVRMATARVSGEIETPTSTFAFEGTLRAGTHLTIYDLFCEGWGGAIWQWGTGVGETKEFSFVIEQQGESLFGRLALEAIADGERLFHIEAHPSLSQAVNL